MNIQQEIEAFSYFRCTKPLFDGTVDSIYKIVLGLTGYGSSSGRRHDYVFARQLTHATAHILKERYDIWVSLKQIANETGLKSHATVKHSVKTISKYLTTGYMVDIISECAIIFGLDIKDYIIDQQPIAKQYYIKAEKDGETIRFRNMKEATDYFGVTKGYIYKALSGLKLKSYELTY